MYEYAPRFKKKKEKTLCWFFALIGCLLVLLPSFLGDALPLPAVVQALGVGCIAVMILIFSLVVSKHYIYSIAEADEDGNADFLITECAGPRRTVVCRVSTTSVLEVIPVTEESRKIYASRASGMRQYHYTGVLFGEDRRYLKIEEGGETFLVQICATDDLILRLTTH